MPELRLRVLGAFEVEVDGRELPPAAWRRNRARSLVKILAIAPGTRLHREQLMDALWPDLEPDSAAANLRKALHFARAAVGADHLRTEGAHLALAGDPLWIDAVQFEAESRAGNAGGALAMYRGDLLPEDRFEPWADEPRERLRTKFLRVLRDHAEELERMGDLAAACETLERLVGEDPLNEDGHLALMRLLGRLGERHRALRQYRVLEDGLRNELGVEPDLAARELNARLLSGSLVAREETAAPQTATVGAAEAADAAEAAEELRLVTVVWADLPVTDTDVEATRQRSAEWIARALDGLAAAGASAEEVAGGGVVGMFGLPAVREGDVDRALRTALDLTALSPGVRVGISTGPVIAPMRPRPRPGDVTGPAIQEAGQLRARARPGSVLVASRSARAAAGSYVFEPPVGSVSTGPEAHALRGLQAIHIGGRRGDGDHTSPRSDGPLVGRARELDGALAVIREAFKHGVPGAVLVVGAAGVGKSRLAREVAMHVAAGTDRPALFVVRCQAAGRAGAYRPLAEILGAACEISLAGQPARIERRLRRSIATLLPDAPDDERRPLMHALGTTAGLALTGNPLDELRPSEVATRLAVAWPRFVSALAARRPTLLVVEDLHWAAPELIDMLEHIVRRSEGRLAVLATTRPDLRTSRPEFGIDERFVQISLPPLGDADSRALIAQLIPGDALERLVADDVLARADGNPLYLEQLALHVRSAGAALPDSLQSLLSARFDLLSIADRRLLQEAAVVGRIFWAEPLLRAIDDPRIEARLAMLERKGFVVRRPASSLPGQSEYAFRHALLHDVAYQSLPRARRAVAHAKTGRWLEQLAGERASEVIDLLAHHFWSAVESATALAGSHPVEQEALRASAFDTLMRAGRAARRQFLIEHASEIHGRAQAIAVDDGERVRVLEELAEDAEAGFGGDTAASDFDAALAIARRTGTHADIARLIRKLAWLQANLPGAFKVSPDPGPVEDLIADGLALEPAAHDRAWLLISKAMIRRLYRGSEPFGQGAQLDPRPIEARIASAHEGAAIGERLGSAEIVRASRQALGILYGIGGRYPEMVELAERDAADVRLTDSRLEQSDTIRKLATVRIAIEGTFEEGLALGRRAKALGGDGPPHQQMHALSPILVGLFQLGRWDELDAAVKEHMVAFRLDPATECQAVRDGPAIGATVLALRGRTEAAAGLASLLGDPLSDPSASAWQARYATASGRPELARAIAENRALERRTYGPQHAFALLEALSALGDLEAADAFLPEARREVGGNAMLAPLVDRLDGEILLATGDRDAAAVRFRAAVSGFERLKCVLEEARALESLAAVLAMDEAERTRRRAAAAYSRLGMRSSR